MIIESTRRMTKQEQEAYDLGFHEGKYSSISKWISVEERLPKCGGKSFDNGWGGGFRSVPEHFPQVG